MQNLPLYPLKDDAHNGVHGGFTFIRSIRPKIDSVYLTILDHLEIIKEYFGDYTITQANNWIMLLMFRHEVSGLKGCLEQYRGVVDDFLLECLDINYKNTIRDMHSLDNITILTTILFFRGYYPNSPIIKTLEELVQLRNQLPPIPKCSPYVLADTV